MADPFDPEDGEYDQGDTRDYETVAESRLFGDSPPDPGYEEPDDMGICTNCKRRSPLGHGGLCVDCYYESRIPDSDYDGDNEG